MRNTPYTHPVDAAHAITIGGKMLRPGETRMVDAALVPGGVAPAASTAKNEPPAETNMASLQADSVKAITAQLPKLSNEQLDELLTIERKAEKPRTTMTHAVEEEQLKRKTDDEQPGDAACNELREKSVDEITEVLPTLSDAELERLQVLESRADEPRVMLIDAIGVEGSNRQAPE